jgi:hypothetical protein
MPLSAYNLEQAIDKFWQVKEVTAKKMPGPIKDKHYYECYLMFLLIQASKISSNTQYSKIFLCPFMHITLNRP